MSKNWRQVVEDLAAIALMTSAMILINKLAKAGDDALAELPDADESLVDAFAQDIENRLHVVVRRWAQ